MSDIKIGKITLGICQTNTYFILREGSSDIIVVDPADKGALLYENFKDKGYTVKAILLTHGHFDHILGVPELKERSGCEVYASEDELKMLSDPTLNMTADYGRDLTLNPEHLLTDNEELSLCGINIKVLKTPGHTEGGCCYYIEEANMLISGDTLFEGSVGRTDFPGGSMSALIRSIKEKLMALPDETVAYPGHGGVTTIGDERKYNPFL